MLDDRLGPVLSGFPFSLTPGASIFLTASEALTVSVIGSATWTAYNPGPVDLVSESDSVTVTVTAPAPDISFDMTVGTDPALCAAADSLTLPPGGESVTYCFLVTNTGNITLTRHTLVDEQLGPLLFDAPIALPPGEFAFILHTVHVAETSVSNATWTAYNPGPQDEVSGTGGATVFVEYGLYLPLIRKE